MSLYTPAKCVILGIDPGKRSGCAIIDDGELVDVGAEPEGKGDEFRDKTDWVWCAQHDAGSHAMPLVIAAETWTPHGRWGTKQLIGLGAHWGEWLAEIKKLPKIKRWSVKTVRYTPQQWRQALWGRRWGNKPSDQWDAETIAYARATWPAFEFDRDSAVAACIALVASRDPNVHRLPGCAAKEGK